MGMPHGRRDLFVLFVVGILLPGAILAVFGFRSMRQDRLLAERQTRDALESTANLAAREVSRDLARWPDWKEPDSASLTFTSGGSLQAANGLLWVPGGFPELKLAGDAYLAEEAEIRQQDYAKALHLYEGALRGVSPGARAAVLLRIARTARKAGDLVKARAAWRRILVLPQSPATAAARLALVDLGEAPALELYRDLLAGRIPLARESYFFYSGRVKDMLRVTEVERLREVESRRVALTEAAEAFLAVPRRIPAPGFVAFWEPTRAVVVPEYVLHARLTKAARVGMDAAITLRPRLSPLPDLAVVRPLEDPQLPWQLEAATRDAAALNRALRNRQTWFLGAMAVVLAALLSGVSLTARAIRREWEFSRLQSDFVATVSHEFRSPLTGIRQLAELLDSGIVHADNRRREYYRLIVQESDRLTHLVENLLDFSRLEANRKQYRMEEAIDASTWLADTAAATRNARLSADIPAGLPSVRGDREALASAVVNLVDNAIKYSPPDSPVRLAAQSVNGRLSISVTDWGPGIALEEQGRIFDRFYRGCGDLTRRVKGAGIGLSLVKRIVEDHGGNVSVASCPDEGSTFTIELNAVGGQTG
jgi:signal transduction histidine kinase